jgi:hypothetical protein
MATTTTKTDGGDPCCCSPCARLDCAERPLFGTGQTLAAADLTALLDYVRTKNRLHNRYQHGWGVVCGLEVLCHDCEGSVTIRPGYAIDPCGEDIVVADAVRFDVIEAIRDCTRTTRTRRGDCDPWVPPLDQGCGEALSHWCIAIRYREVETAVGQRLTTGGLACETLGKGRASCGSGECETPRTRPVADYRPSTLAASNACAPRRVRECFDLTLIPRKEPCAPKLPEGRDPIGTTNDNRPALGLIGWLIPEKSLLRNIIDCVLNDVAVVADRLTAADRAVLSQLGSGTPAELEAAGIDLDAVHLAICHARGAVLEVLQDDHGTTRCQLLRATADVTLAPPSRDANGELLEAPVDYIARAQERTSDLVAAWAQAILDCICRAFLPRCPEDPCDDRVELACISVQGGKILSVCNQTCRKFAGAFPSTFYWMSLVPLIPLFARMLAMLCCRPDLLRKNSPLVNDLLPLLDRVDPTGRLRREVVKNNFELPRRYVAMAAKFSKTPVIPAISARLERAAAAVIDRSAQAAPAAGKGVSETDALREELTALKAEVGALRAQLAPAKPASGRTASKSAAGGTPEPTEPSRSTKPNKR